MELANPYSTGAGGPDLERRIAASFVCQALVGMASAPLGKAPSSLWLQCGHLGSAIDDVLVEVQKLGDAGHARCYWSMKSTITLTAGDREFREFCSRAWNLYQDSTLFDRTRDWIALGVSTSRSPRIQRLIQLSELARACENHDDFQNRLSIPKYYNLELRGLFDAIGEVAVGANDKPDVVTVHGFVQRLYAASFDFDQEHSQDKSRTLVMLTLACTSELTDSEACWNTIFESISSNTGKARHLNEDAFRNFAKELNLKRNFDQLSEQWLTELRRHCAMTRKRVSPHLHVTGLHLERHQIVDAIRRFLDESRLVLIKGAAGSGKSAIALQAADEMAGSPHVFCFGAEEFLHAHLDAALQAAGLRQVSFDQWSAILPSTHPTLVVDGVERLLQRDDSREAFSDLVRAVKRDTRWRLVLTCRDYQSETLRHLLLDLCIEVPSIEVPSLSRGELDCALSGTKLEPLVHERPALRETLTNLKWLDLSLSAMERQTTDGGISWSTTSAWRNHIWQRLVKERDGAKRERCLVQIALSRLHLAHGWVDVSESHADTAEDLTMAGLLRKANGRFTPEHDLIEDWALLIHLDQIALETGVSLDAFTFRVGDSLPIRRVFRQWLGEQLDEQNPNGIAWLNLGLSADQDNIRWRDEVILAILGSREIPTILARTRELWIVGNGYLFLELIRCLQIAYVSADGLTSIERPIGPGWAAVFEFILKEGRAFFIQHLVQITRLMLKWKSAVTIEWPAPAGLDAAAQIVLMIWHHVSDNDLSLNELLGDRHGHYREEDHPLSQLIGATAAAIPVSFFEAIIMASSDEGESNWRSIARSKQILASITGSHLAYHFAQAQPQLSIRMFNLQWGVTPSFRTNRRSRYRNESGMIDGNDFNHSSALVGPFLALLRHHRELGITFIVDLLNFEIREERSANFEDFNELDSFEFVWEDLTLTQWGHQGWWRAYRGGSLQHWLAESALMALEKWLLEDLIADDQIETLCLGLIKRSESLAVTAVVASVAMAMPRRFVAFPLMVLRQPRMISLDRHRWMNDKTSRLFRDIYDSDPESWMERNASNHLPHRDFDLEHYIIAAQFGPARDGIHSTLTALNDEVGLVDKTAMSEEELERLDIYRLLIHRIDTRQMTAVPLRDTNGGIALVTANLPSDLESIVVKAGEAGTKFFKRQEAMLWASNMFESNRPNDLTRWQDMLLIAQHLELCDENELFMFGAMPSHVASACVTYFWDELSAKEQTWCCEKLADYLLGDEPMTTWREGSILMFRDMHFGQVAQGLGVACGRLPIDHPIRKACLESCAIALSHPEEKVAMQAATGLGRVASTDRASDLQLSAADLMFAHARAEHEVNYKYRGPYNKSDMEWSERRAAMHEELLHRIRILRRKFVDEGSVKTIQLSRNCVRGFPSHQRLGSILKLLICNPTPDARRVFERAARWLFCTWAKVGPGYRRSYRHGEHQLRGDAARNPVTIGIVKALIAKRMLMQPEEGLHLTRQLLYRCRIVGLRDKANEMLYSLSIALDADGDIEVFWSIWRQCRDAAYFIGSKLGNEDFWNQNRFSEQAVLECYSSLLSSLFFNQMHFGASQQWGPLEGHETEITNAFLTFGPYALRRYIVFLGSIGSDCLPEAWEHMAQCSERLQNKVPLGDILNESSESVLLRLIQSEISQRRISQSNRKSWDFIHHILDEFTTRGSSTAFHLREEIARNRVS